MEDPWRVVGIDIGYSHLATVVCDVDRETFEITPVFGKMVDLRDLCCKDKDCMFERNDRKAGHLVHHYIELMFEWFDTADQILLEAQPICSTHKDVEQLIFVYCKQRFSLPKKKSKDHVKLLHPRSMHSHFAMSSEKVTRRLEVVDIAEPYLKDMPAFFKAKERDHLADSFAYILLYTRTIMPTLMWKMKPNQFDKFRMDET